VGTFDRFQQSRCVIEDFTSRTLAVIPSEFGRLYYVSSLKDSANGRYLHDGLVELYSEDSVQVALGDCHEELFSRILETPLPEQERDLRSVLTPPVTGFGPLWMLGGRISPSKLCVRRACRAT